MEHEKRGTFDRFINKIMDTFKRTTKTTENENDKWGWNIGWLPSEHEKAIHDNRFDNDRMRDNISEIMD